MGYQNLLPLAPMNQMLFQKFDYCNDLFNQNSLVFVLATKEISC